MNNLEFVLKYYEGANIRNVIINKENENRIVMRFCPIDIDENLRDKGLIGYGICRPDCEEWTDCEECWKLEVDEKYIKEKEEAKKNHEKILENENKKVELTDLDRFKKITGEIISLYELKNKNYGNSFSKQFEKRGLTSVCIRLEDKLNRLDSLDTQGKSANVDDESIKDTLIDIANYSILTIIELLKKEEKNV